MKVKFNRNPLRFGNTINQPISDEIRCTPSLFNASLEDAIQYGGPLTREALGAMNLTSSRKYTIVDTKVHMLMPGMYPAIPGWHTDGVPRDNEEKAPDIAAQEELDSPLFHLLVTGEGCLTDFLTEENFEVEVPDKPDPKLYEVISDYVTEIWSLPKIEIPSCTVVEWDWWNLHTAKAATKREWRFLIRVTETDYRAPKTDLRDIIRTQQQVYVPEAFGW